MVKSIIQSMFHIIICLYFFNTLYTFIIEHVIFKKEFIHFKNVHNSHMSREIREFIFMKAFFIKNIFIFFKRRTNISSRIFIYFIHIAI